MSSLSGIAWLDSLTGSGIRPGLTRMRTILRSAGNPHRAVPAIVVAGTNGKGSTAATLASVLTASGYRTGLYTSPHLVSLNERWRIGSLDVDDPKLDTVIDELRHASGSAGIVPTYFEALTLLAFLLFRRERCDVSVLEVGMGGRLDATNVVRPIASVITPVGLDHMEYLGTTLRSIAREKAGIIHRGAVVASFNREPVVRRVIATRAALFECPMIDVPNDSQIGEGRVVNDEQSFELRTPLHHHLLSTPLQGAHQRENVTLAVRTAEALGQQGWNITRETIARGVRETRWAGRLERRSFRGRELWLDGAHNPHAMERLVAALDPVHPPRTLLFAMMRDKNMSESLALLAPHFARVIFTQVDFERGATPEELLECGEGFAWECIALADVSDALEFAISSSDGAIVVTGSLYLVGAVSALLNERSAADARSSVDNAHDQTMD